MRAIRALFIFIFCYTTLNCIAQQPGSDTTRPATGTRQINILRSDRLNYKKIDTTELQSAGGNVLIRQETTLFYCDSVVLNKNLNMLQAYGHVHINDNDSVQTYSDYLRYTGNDRKAYLNGNVKLTDGKGTLTTPDLNYDMNTKTGVYTKGGKVVSDSTVLNSQEGTYYGATRDVYFKKNVKLVSPRYNVVTDTLLFNTYTNIATFIVPTTITSADSKRKIITSDGYYNLKSDNAYFGKRPHIEDSTTILDADIVATDSTGFSEAKGNVIYKDTAQGVAIVANNLKTNRNDESFLATQNPVMILKQETDSIYIAADTFFSARLSQLKKYRVVPQILDSLPPRDSALSDSAYRRSDSADRFVEAYYHVKIFSDSLQAVGDSLFYSGEDSAFRLFRNPVLWSQQSQVTGDTIYMFTKNKQPDRLYVFENAMTIQKVNNADFYNQVRGRTINGYFKNGSIDYVRTKGAPAESIYYPLDDSSKFIGMNKSTSDVIDMYFVDKEVNKVMFINNVDGTTFPMRQIKTDDMILRGFKWEDARRPKTKYDLFGN